MQKIKFINSLVKLIFACCLMILILSGCLQKSNVRAFPIESYDQNVSIWLNPKANNYTRNLLSTEYQNQRLLQLTHLYFGTSESDNSPWSKSYIEFLFNPQEQAGKTLYLGEKSQLQHFDNTGKKWAAIFYGMNLLPHDKKWIEKIAQNMHISQFASITYTPASRGIMVDNAAMRILPTNDPAYYNFKIAGEGYPFDNLQGSSIYAGTPVYIMGKTLDQQWNLVLSPDGMAWVDSRKMALVDQQFIETWQRLAYNKLTVITNVNVSIIDNGGTYQYPAYVGMIFPYLSQTDNRLNLAIPVKLLTGFAGIRHASLTASQVSILPLPATPENFSHLFSVLQDRPYGWGGKDFYNDCSAEMKAIFATFGFYLPRNSGMQTMAGKLVSLNAASPENRYNYVKEHGVSLLTLIHFKGHVALYVSNYTDKTGEIIPLTYQQVWGRPADNEDIRSIIGKSVFFPLARSYPQDKHLVNQLSGKVFELVYLNQWGELPFKPSLNQLLY